jgi:hypothetical protein
VHQNKLLAVAVVVAGVLGSLVIVANMSLDPGECIAVTLPGGGSVERCKKSNSNLDAQQTSDFKNIIEETTKLEIQKLEIEKQKIILSEQQDKEQISKIDQEIENLKTRGSENLKAVPYLEPSDYELFKQEIEEIKSAMISHTYTKIISELVIDADETFVVNKTDSIQIIGRVDNYGTVENYGYLEFNGWGTENNGRLVNHGQLSNDGIISFDRGGFDNSGNVKNNKTIITNWKFNNSNSFENNGEIRLDRGADFVNRESFVNNGHVSKDCLTTIEGNRISGTISENCDISTSP